jgi:glycosyltransferase involved in cell wall biosynthesis
MSLRNIQVSPISNSKHVLMIFMRVLHLVPSLPPSDFVRKDMEYTQRITGIQPAVMETGKAYGRSIISLFFIFVQALKILRHRPDVIHCHFMAGTLTKALVPIPAVVTVHESHNYYSSIWRAILRITTRMCKIIYVSHYSHDYWSRFLDKDGTIVYHAINTDEYSPRNYSEDVRQAYLKELGSKHLIFTMGALESRRGLHLPLMAARILRERGLDVGVVIKGYGGSHSYGRKLERYAEKNEIPLLLVMRFLPKDEMLQLQASVDIFVRPTIVESFGLAVLEAQASGVPTVVSDCCSLKEIFAGSSLLFVSKNEADLADGIECILASPRLREFLIESGRKLAQSLSWENKIAAYMDCYIRAIRQ